MTITTGPGTAGVRAGLDPNWTLRAACRDADPDELFVQGAEQHRAKVLCQTCPVRTECLADALDNRVEFGVWGGMTERERRALLRRRADVTSWWDLLGRARRAHDSGRCPDIGSAAVDVGDPPF